MKRAVIFDMDGIIVDSEPLYLKECVSFLAANNINIGKKELSKFVGVDENKFWDKIAANFSQRYSRDVLENMYNEHAISINYQDIMNPYIRIVLRKLKDHGYKIGLASSSSQTLIQTILNDCQLLNYFDHIVSGEMFAESKPNPEIYLYMMNCLGVTAEETIAVEDSDIGIAAAKSAGIYVIAKEEKRFGFSQDNADIIIGGLDEILDILALT